MAEFNLPKTPQSCLCERMPTVSKGKGGWVLACPAWQTCSHAPTGDRHRDLSKAIDAWDYIVKYIREKEAKK